MADAFGTPGGFTSAKDQRLDQGGLLATSGATTLDVRTGVLWGPGTTTLVTGTSATGTMTVSIAPHHAVTSRGAGDGPYLGPTLESSTTVNIGAAPASNSRIDVVYEKQADAAATISPDGATAPEYGVVPGTASATPTKPSLASVVGAVEIATVQVASTATSTLGAGVTITNTALQTVARGAAIPVRNTTERAALTTFTGLTIARLDDGGRHERWNGSRWAPVSTADRTVAEGWLTAADGTLLTVAYPTWTDIVTVTGTSTGGECVARFDGSAFNGNSGADRTLDWRVVCDGVFVGGFVNIDLALANLRPVTKFGAPSSTPTAGSHTWKLQATPSAANTIYIDSARLIIVEK